MLTNRIPSPRVLLTWIALGSCAAAAPPTLPPSVTFLAGPVNGVVIQCNNRSLVVYGDPHGSLTHVDWLLLTHARRDVVWAAQNLVQHGARLVAPATEAAWLNDPQAFWNTQTRERYHDYAQQSTRLPTAALPVTRQVTGRDQFEWEGLTFHVLDTPGYTRGSVSYWADIGDVRIAFVGDLIYGQGKLLDLYSLQDAVPEANIMGYHGYAGRLGPLIQSLQTILQVKPQILIPARGPLITDPNIAIQKLLERTRSAYAAYLSISAGRWYFREAYDTLATRILGDQAIVDWMPWAERIDQAPPPWIVPIQNSRLLLSDTRRGFLVDCGYRSIVNRLIEMRDSGALTDLDGLFITHYHDDHTDAVTDLLKEFNCPVYACGPLVDVLKHPAKYRLPAMTSIPIPDIRSMSSGVKFSWAGLTLTLYDFPGQTLYHNALLVESDSRPAVMFIGDSFTPSGIDDYCLLNRNFIADSFGYLRCLDILRQLPARPLLINQHVLEPFRFDDSQLEHMQQSLKQRARLLQDLFPWNDPNEGIDDRWIQLLPYSQSCQPGEAVPLTARVLNHHPQARTFRLRPHTPDGWTITPPTHTITLPPRTEQDIGFSIQPRPDASLGVHVITLDLDVDDWQLRRWSEAMVEVGPTR